MKDIIIAYPITQEVRYTEKEIDNVITATQQTLKKYQAIKAMLDAAGSDHIEVDSSYVDTAASKL